MPVMLTADVAPAQEEGRDAEEDRHVDSEDDGRLNAIDPWAGVGAGAILGGGIGGDAEDGVLTPECAPASGLTFPLGETLVSCSATDSNGNITEDDFMVTVVDTTVPAVNLPITIVVPATSEQGAIVNYTASATDLVDPNPAVSCSTPSGTTLPVGSWIISCSATDAAGNASDIENFTVVVEGASAQLVDLRDYIVGLDLQRGTKTSLRVKVEAARVAVAFGATEFACDSLQSLINQSNAQRGKKLTIEQADRIIADATRIQNVLGCD